MNMSVKRQSLEDYLTGLREQRDYHMYNRRVGIANGNLVVVHRCDRKIDELEKEIKKINDQCLDEMLKELG